MVIPDARKAGRTQRGSVNYTAVDRSPLTSPVSLGRLGVRVGLRLGRWYGVDLQARLFPIHVGYI